MLVTVLSWLWAGTLSLHDVAPLQNVTHCVLVDGHNASACAAFASFNLTACELAHERDSSLPLLPTAAASCLHASGCLPLYGVPACVGPGGFNLTDLDFNYSSCLYLFAATNATLAPNATGCEGLLPSNFTNTTAKDVIEEEVVEEEEEGLPRFTPCVGAMDQDKLRRLDFLSAFKSYVYYMVAAISPDDGPVTGGTSVAVCGLGFRLTNENINHLKCRFSDGHHTKDVPAIYVSESMLRCTTPDFSRFLVGLPHHVTVEVSLNRGQHFSNNGARFTFFSTRPSIDGLGYPMWGYDTTHKKAGWQTKEDYPEADIGWKVPELYPSRGHPLSKGVPSPWDQQSDPFHTEGAAALLSPTELDVGDRMPPADDFDERARFAAHHGVEGSWGDRMSFLRAHSLVPDKYRHAVVAARGEAKASFANGVI
tara:strand:- start:501 stop:1772 length:1272 start_codon:yes stop_codon:yes gene_type:complete